MLSVVMSVPTVRTRSLPLIVRVAVSLAAYALYIESFGTFIAAGALFGINMAFTQQYR